MDAQVEMLINMLKKHNPGKKVTALAIAGGPACDWERAELRNTFCKNHRELVLKHSWATSRTSRRGSTGTIRRAGNGVESLAVEADG